MFLLQGNVSYGKSDTHVTPRSNCCTALPSLHPGFAIPTVPNGGNHTREFAKAAATVEAHKQCLIISIALAGTAIRVLTDDTYFEEVTRIFHAHNWRILM